MYLKEFVYKIIDYLVVTTRHTTNNQGNTMLVLYLEYSYKMEISSLKSYKSCTFIFRFDKEQGLYKLTNHQLIELIIFLVKDKMLIRKADNYYLTESALLRIL